MILRRATISDLPMLRHWDQQAHVIAAAPDSDWDWEEGFAQNPDWREWLIAQSGAVPIGFIQIIDPALEETHYWGAVEDNLRAIDIWIGEEQHLGKGYGTQMMHLVIRRCFDSPEIRAILIDPLVSNTKAIRFYERLGFKRMERRFFDEDECFVYQLSRNDYFDAQ
jgi:aminoglycoside 6'-N-acetyltransferase